jgi:hypothetical protein
LPDIETSAKSAVLRLTPLERKQPIFFKRRRDHPGSALIPSRRGHLHPWATELGRYETVRR